MLQLCSNLTTKPFLLAWKQLNTQGRKFRTWDSVQPLYIWHCCNPSNDNTVSSKKEMEVTFNISTGDETNIHL